MKKFFKRLTGPRLWRIMAIGGVSAASLLASKFLYPTGLAHTALHEIGFALLVSLIVWHLFEAQLSQEAESAWDGRIDRMTKNVFNAVLRKDLPKALLDETNNLVLNSSLIRESFSVTYTLRDENIGVKNCTDCVLVDAVVEFSMRNISTDKFDWPVRVALPNPVHDELKSLVEVSSIEVTKGGEIVPLEMKAGEEKFRQELDDNTLTKAVFHAGTVSLASGEICAVRASYTMAKEAEDSEVLQTLYPADGLRVTIFDQAGSEKRIILASSVHRNQIERLSQRSKGAGAEIFKVPGYLLPHQGVLIWWKKAPGEPERHSGAPHTVDKEG